MVNEEIIDEIDSILRSRLKTSKLAIISMVFGILGPFSAGAMWIVSYSNFLNVGSPLIIFPFSCGIAWILGLALGVKSLEQINDSEGQLHGKEYALVGIITSTVWMIVILICLLLPAIYSINS